MTCDTFFHLPIYTVAGAALMGTWITSVAGVAFYKGIAPFYPTMSIEPDWLLGILFGLGGVCGRTRHPEAAPNDPLPDFLRHICVFSPVSFRNCCD
jgi:hypothetical protein